MKKIKLTRGKETSVDDDVFELVGNLKWYCTNAEYAQRDEIVLGKRTHILLHRLILKPSRELFVDHINGDKLDNRRINLRIATKTQNNGNSCLNYKNTTGYKGVSFFKRDGNYEAYIWRHNKKYRIGYFYDLNEAALAYNKAAEEYFGEFARLNNIDEQKAEEIRIKNNIMKGINFL